ncbi:hypothetical protein [Micromonospora sp. NPDC048830]|uniref:hypothetical protein n=1 Tax=Micromonospora sp. NPDC048830 TaxID=3364257 RepID=UPI00371FA6E7
MPSSCADLLLPFSSPSEFNLTALILGVGLWIVCAVTTNMPNLLSNTAPAVAAAALDITQRPWRRNLEGHSDVTA